MRKRILLAEESDATRGVAESLLRQNGFEVVSVASSQKAKEVLSFARPDLLIIGGELQSEDGKPLYSTVSDDPKHNSVPCILLIDQDEADIPSGPYTIVKRPIEPRSFVETVLEAVNAEAPKSEPEANFDPDDPFADEFLDSALGGDQLGVTNSEIVENSQPMISQKLVEESETPVVLGPFVGDDNLNDSGGVESVVISEDLPKGKSVTPSDDLDIVPTNFDLANLQSQPDGPEDAVHDYNWFVNEMQQESAGKPAKSDSSDGAELKITNPADAVDPITPPPPSAPRQSRPSRNKKVDDIVDEFRREVEKVRNHEEPGTVLIPSSNPGSAKSDSSARIWEDAIEQINDENLSLFTRQFASELAEKIASKILSKLDMDKLQILLKSEILARLDQIVKK